MSRYPLKHRLSLALRQEKILRKTYAVIFHDFWTRSDSTSLMDRLPADDSHERSSLIFSGEGKEPLKLISAAAVIGRSRDVTFGHGFICKQSLQTSCKCL